MTEKRYFYTDPLAAAWMAKHFGMVLTDEHCEAFGNFINGEFYYGDGERFKYEHYFIHPDSLPLLEPQDGDRIVYPSKRGVLINASILRTLHRRNLMQGYVAIIQRDGKAFHWPECEE